MVAMTQQTFSKTPRQMLRSLAESVLRRIDDPQCDVATVAEAARQHAELIVCECRQQAERIERTN